MTSPPPRLLVIVWAALMALLAMTYAIAQFDLGPLNLVAALAIAAAKAGLVLWFFMEVRANSQLVNLFAGSGFCLLGLLLCLGLADFLSRGWFLPK